MVNREFCGDVFNRFEYFGFYQKNAYSVLHSTILARGKGLVQSFTLLKLLIWMERKGDHSLRELIFVNFLKAVPRKFLGCVCVCLHFVLKVLVFCLFVCFCLRYGRCWRELTRRSRIVCFLFFVCLFVCLFVSFLFVCLFLPKIWGGVGGS